MQKRIFSNIGHWFPIILIFIWGCSGSQSNTNISSDEFKKLTANHKNSLILDVRTDMEVAEGIIPNAVQIDFNADDFEQKIDRLDKNKTVFVYCAAGGRSSAAASILAGKGFKKVYNLDGGMNAWREKGFSVVKNNN